MAYIRVCLLMGSVLVLAACAPGDDAAEQAPVSITDKFGSEHFLQFFNKQASLPEGKYRLVAATFANSQAGSFTLAITYDDGSSETINGAWSNSGGQNPLAAGNPSYPFTLAQPGGIKAVLISPSVDTYLYVVRDDIAVFEDDDGGGGTNGTDALIDLPHSRTNDPRYATAYYATIDGTNSRDTLAKWKQANGFDLGETAHVIFRDTKDLGYGRDMYFRDQGGGQYAFFVNNFVVDKVPGQSYGSLNLNAAIAQDSQYHIGTNAIEYGPIDADGTPGNDDVNFDGVVDDLDYFPRFYNFSSKPPYERRLTVDLDGKGEKAMPGPCIVCHGGRADALVPAAVNANSDSKFPRSGDTLAHLQPLDVGSFEYSSQSPWTRAEMEPLLKVINKAIYDSYAANVTPGYGYAEWDSTTARGMLESWYGGVNLPGNFSDSYVPSGWTPGGSIPAGADSFYRDVIAENCRTCHLQRGIVEQSDIDFTSYSKFIGYADRIEDLVFDRGLMPLAALTFRNFYQSWSVAERLAEFLEDNASFSHRAGDGSLLLPGRPVARAGPDRVSPSPVAISGVASLFASTFEWRIIDRPAGATDSLTGSKTVRPTLAGDIDGAYTLSLVVSDGKTFSEPDTVTVTIDSAVAAPSSLNFADDIQPLLTTTYACTDCHLPGGGPPVYYTTPGPGENRNVYQTFRSLADFADPANSRMILKPTGNHHGGGPLVTPGSADYHTLLNWVSEGARE